MDERQLDELFERCRMSTTDWIATVVVVALIALGAWVLW
jgi:hypothetical protein